MRTLTRDCDALSAVTVNCSESYVLSLHGYGRNKAGTPFHPLFSTGYNWNQTNQTSGFHRIKTNKQTVTYDVEGGYATRAE
jgi:hypothetical protein